MVKIIRNGVNDPKYLKESDIVAIDVRVENGFPMVTNDDSAADGTASLVWDLKGYLREADKKDVQLIAVNIRTDGQEKRIIETLENSKIPYFVCNMSRPSYHKYQQMTDNIALPVSEYDHVSSLLNYKTTKWVLLDCFNNDVNGQIWQYQNTPADINVVWIAPDLRGLREFNEKIKRFITIPNSYVLTDYPEDFE